MLVILGYIWMVSVLVAIPVFFFMLLNAPQRDDWD